MGKIFCCTSGGTPPDALTALRNTNLDLLRLNTQLSRSETDLQNRVSSLENTINDLNKTVADLTKNLETSNSQNKELHSSAASLSASRDNYKLTATLAKNAICNIFRAAIQLGYSDSLYNTATSIMGTILIVGKKQQNLITECLHTAMNKPQPQSSPAQLPKIPLSVTALPDERALVNNLAPVEPPSPIVVTIPSPESKTITPFSKQPAPKDKRRRTAPNGQPLLPSPNNQGPRRTSALPAPRGRKSVVAS